MLLMLATHFRELDARNPSSRCSFFGNNQKKEKGPRWGLEFELAFASTPRKEATEPDEYNQGQNNNTCPTVGPGMASQNCIDGKAQTTV